MLELPPSVFIKKDPTMDTQNPGLNQKETGL